MMDLTMNLYFLPGKTQVVMNLVMSGLWFYVYNELLGEFLGFVGRDA